MKKQGGSECRAGRERKQVTRRAEKRIDGREGGREIVAGRER